MIMKLPFAKYIKIECSIRHKKAASKLQQQQQKKNTD